MKSPWGQWVNLLVLVAEWMWFYYQAQVGHLSPELWGVSCVFLGDKMLQDIEGTLHCIEQCSEWKMALDKRYITGAILWICRRPSIAFHMVCWLPNQDNNTIQMLPLLQYMYIGSYLWQCHAYGLTVPACELLADYLSHRKQRIKVGNTTSSWADLHKGVPQGSILGPLLLNIFINDLFLFIENCSLYNYPDDNTVSFSAPSLSDVVSNLQLDCNHAIDWFTTNSMEANPNKF